MSKFDDITMDDINSATDTDGVVEPVAPAPPPAVTEAAPEVAPVPAAAPVTHPWDTDLEFVPADLRDQVSAYLADKWQPRMTKYEQDLKEWQDSFDGNTDHRDLGAKVIRSFKEDPQKAFLELGVEMGYIDPNDLGEGWEQYADQLTAPAAAVAEAAADDDRLTAEEKRVLAWASTQMEEQGKQTQQEVLHSHYNELAAQYGIEENFDLDLFDTMFGGALGDVPKAVALYKSVKVAEGHEVAPAPTPATPAPPVLNDLSGGQAPPEEEHYDSFDAVTKALLAEMRAAEGR